MGLGSSAARLRGLRLALPLARPPLVSPSLRRRRRRRHCPYSNCTVQPKPRMMLATPFLVSPRARGVLPCLKGAAAAGPPPRPARPPPARPRRPEQARQVPSCHVSALPWGFARCARETELLLGFVELGGGPARPQGAPLPLTSPPRCAAPCQLASLSGPRAPRGAGGAGPPGWRGWGTPDKQAPSLCAGAGARGAAGFAPDAWGVAGWQRGRGGLCALLGPTRAWVAAAPAAEGSGGRGRGGDPGPAAGPPEASVCPPAEGAWGRPSGDHSGALGSWVPKRSSQPARPRLYKGGASARRARGVAG